VRLVTIADALDRLRSEAQRRTFGVIDPDRRAVLRHGYLLALDDLQRALNDTKYADPPRARPGGDYDQQ